MRRRVTLAAVAALAACGDQSGEGKEELAPFGTPEDPDNSRGITAKDLGPLEKLPPDRIFPVEGRAYPLPPPVNTSASEYNPEPSANGLRLYFSSRRPGGEGSNDLYVATRDSVDAPFTRVENLGPGVNTEYWETGPSPTDDELELYYTSKRDGSRDIYVARRQSTEEPFGPGEKLPAPINGPKEDSGPYVSGDGLFMVFSSIREGNVGHRDLFRTRRASRQDPWGEPERLGGGFNTVSADASPAMSADGLTLLFHSRRRGGTTKHDIMIAHRAALDAPWGEPRFLGINTPDLHEGNPSLSSDGRTMFFRANSHDGMGEGLQDIWALEGDFTAQPGAGTGGSSPR